jgi:hypothetical protein
MRAAGAALVFLLASAGEVSAHRLDEYLQAARVALDRDRVTLEIDLTPGMSIASALNAVVDRDRDSAISPEEAEAYGRAVLADVVLEVDGRHVPMTLTRVDVPSPDEMRSGLGTIQVRALGQVRVAAGRRHLRFRNNHHPDAAVYLVNALLPEHDDVDVVNQIRDRRQREVRVEYHIGPYWPRQAAWVGFVAAAAAIPTFCFRRLSSARRARRWPNRYLR